MSKKGTGPECGYLKTIIPKLPV